MRHLLLLILFISFSSIEAQTLQQGLQEYKRGQFKNSEATLQKALPSAKSPGEKSQMYKYMGISQYMQGRKADAGKSFQGAISANPKISISPDEVLDESVVQFFESQKHATAGAAAKPSSHQSAAAQPSSALPSKKAKLTTLTVKSNIQGSVNIDGILVGQTNSPLEVEAGRVILEVSGAGYSTKKIATKITANANNKIEVNLEKPKPKVVPKPVAKAPVEKPEAKSPGKAVAANSKKKTGDDIFAKDAEDPILNAPSQPQAQVGYQAQQPQMQQPMQQPYQMPPQVIQQPVYVAPPVYQQPMYAQPMYAQPMYPQYGGYQQPYGPPAPPAYDPYAYSAPPQQQYSAPPQSYGAPFSNSGPAAPPPPSVDPDSGSSKGSSKSSKASGTFVKILPFGAGQFYNKSYVKGAVFLGAELGALGFWYYHYNTANQYDAKRKQDLQDLNDQDANTTDDTKKQQIAAEKTRIQDEGDKYLAQEDQNAMLSLAAFGGFYVIGVIDAFIFDDPPVAKGKKKKKRRSGFAFDLDLNHHKPYFAYDFEIESPSDLEEHHVQFGYQAPLTPQDSHAILFGVTSDF